MSLKEYLEKGITVVPSVFTVEECDEIKRQAYLIKDEDIKKAGYPHTPSETIYNKKSLVFFPALANEYLNNIRTDERMVNLVREYIGNDVKQINNQIYFREAGDKDQFAWHRDTIFREPNNFKDDVIDDYFQTIIAVDNIEENNGAIEFIVGSHEWKYFERPRNLRVFERNKLQGTKYLAKKGDVLIWSVAIVHGSESNFSDSDRMTYMNGFCRAKSALTYPYYLIDGKIVKNMNPKLIP
jgi:ectoine hydroxylase-related dioxygenase (phytanoyl-CoA dioxygenase family)